MPEAVVGGRFTVENALVPVIAAVDTENIALFEHACFERLLNAVLAVENKAVDIIIVPVILVIAQRRERVQLFLRRVALLAGIRQDVPDKTGTLHTVTVIRRVTRRLHAIGVALAVGCAVIVAFKGRPFKIADEGRAEIIERIVAEVVVIFQPFDIGSVGDPGGFQHGLAAVGLIVADSFLGFDLCTACGKHRHAAEQRAGKRQRGQPDELIFCHFCHSLSLFRRSIRLARL